MTIDKRRPQPGTATLLPFTPVPRHYQRHDGWTPARQRGFIAALADTGSVKAAAHSVNMTPEGAYHLRRHAKAGEFARAWDHALSLGVQRIEDGLLHRAIHGTEEPVFYQGAQVGTRTRHNDRVNMMILRARKPETYGGTRKFDPEEKAALDRMKAQWREQWTHEQAIEAGLSEREEEDTVLERIKLMHLNWYMTLSPEARAAYKHFRALEDASQGRDWRHEDDREQLEAAFADYQALFDGQADPRPEAGKLVDLGYWREEPFDALGEGKS